MTTGEQQTGAGEPALNPEAVSLVGGILERLRDHFAEAATSRRAGILRIPSSAPDGTKSWDFAITPAPKPDSEDSLQILFKQSDVPKYEINANLSNGSITRLYKATQDTAYEPRPVTGEDLPDLQEADRELTKWLVQQSAESHESD